MKDKKEKLLEIQNLADKHAHIKNIILSMLDELDALLKNFNEENIIKSISLESAIKKSLNILESVEDEYFNLIEEIKKQ